MKAKMKTEDKKSILLVEKQASTEIAEAKIFKQYGYDVIIAYDGDEAVKITNENPRIDSILMNIDLDKKNDGIETAQIILQQRKIPIIFISDHPKNEIIEKIDKIDSYGYVLKNSNEVTLISTIKIALKLFTEQHRLLLNEQKLREKEKTLNLAVEGSQLGLWDQDFITGKVYRNDQWATMLGYDSVDVKNNLDFWKSLIHPDDFDLIITEAKKHEQGLTEYYRVQHRLRDKDGNYKWILNWGKISERDKNGNPVRALGIHIDINDRIIAEEKLKLNEENYRRFFEEDLSGVFLSTPQGKIIKCNQAYVRMMEYDSIDEMLNTNPVNHYTNPQIRIDFLNLLRKEKKLTNYESEVITKKGNKIYTLENIIGLFDDKNNLVEFWGYVNDITDRKKAEQLLKNAAAEKEALHRELLHRVKNSFNLIKSLVFIEREKSNNQVVAKILEDLELRIGTLAQMYSLLNATGLSQQIELGEYLNQITQSLSQSYLEGADGIVIKSSFDKINTSPRTASSVGLIANEILTNSIKYAFPDKKQGTISISLKNINGNAELIIFDNGSGVPKNFDLAKPTGMGLQLVNLLTQQIDGQLLFDGENGTKFTLTFLIEQ